jgi:putative MATE family efflux protein
MRDMTKEPISGHVVHLAMFIALTMAFQTLYFLADLFWVGRLGKEAVAGVGLAGNLTFLVLALTQSLSVGATSLIAQALGRKDHRQAELLFNQSLVLSAIVGLVFGIALFALRGAYSRGLAADHATATLSLQYLNWFVPALFMQFPLVAMGAALRGMGDVRFPTAIQVATVLLNIVLAPTLMFGWITGRPLGVAGTAIASLVSVTAGVLAFTGYFLRQASPMRFRREDWRPRLGLWRDMLRIGLPAGGEFALMSAYMMLIYVIIRPFGAAAQAAFGIGLRLVQSLFLPVVAIGFATAPVAGQNYGARLGERVRQTFYTAAAMSAVVMFVALLLCTFVPEAMVRIFNGDPAVIGLGSEYLRITRWNFLASGVIFVSSSMFQGMGNTLPALASSSLRVLLFMLPAFLLSRQPGFQLRELWYLSVASIWVQLTVNLLLLRREFRRRLGVAPVAAPAPVSG